jgi:DNA-binding MarR family transcriptional regulator
MQRQDTLLPILIKRCARLIDRDIDDTLKRHAIARSQYRVLYYAAKLGEPTQTDLIMAMEVQASTLTLIVDALVKKGWLVRVQDTKDRRINKLRLTPDGERNFKQIPDPAHKLHRKMVKQLSNQEAQQFEQSLQKIINGLR